MNIFGLIAAISGFVGVAAGAFGAHALQELLAARETTEAWRTAVSYHLIHAVALFALALFRGAGFAPEMNRNLGRAGWSWVVGIGLFSGSLYLLALGGPRWLGPATPVGGVALLAGWAFAGLGFRSPSRRT